MDLGWQNYYLSSEDYTCVEKCELVEPRGKYWSDSEEFTVEDSYGDDVVGKVCSCGPGWSRLEVGSLECFDCSTIDPFCTSCELDNGAPICTACSSDYLMPTPDNLKC